MAISANAVWNIMDSATGTAGKNGGFFVTGASGTNYSLQDGAQYALTGVTSNAIGSTILTASAAADMVGNGLFVVSGTGFTLNTWFEITSVVVGVSITCSTSATSTNIATSAAATNGVMNIGGANHLNSALADDMFEQSTAGNIHYIKSGTYTIGESISLTKDGTTTAPIKIIGYTATHGDTCNFSSRPALNFGAFVLALGSYFILMNLSTTGTSTYVVTMGAYNKLYNCKIINKSTTADRIGLTTNTNFLVQNCEVSSYFGKAVNCADAGHMTGCYIHSSSYGVYAAWTTHVVSLRNNLIVDCAIGIYMHTLSGGTIAIHNNTICAPSRAGLSGFIGNYGIYCAGTLATMLSICGNIITGVLYGIYITNPAAYSYGNYNNFYNNAIDVFTWVKDSTDTAVNPSFVSATVVSGATATTTAGNRLVKSGATFQSSGVVAGRDYVYISGTGVTAMWFGILTVENETTLIVDITLPANATADKVFTITVGRNFALGPSMKALAGPPLPCEQTVSYAEQGAVQRKESDLTNLNMRDQLRHR